jgi:predicted permease
MIDSLAVAVLGVVLVGLGLYMLRDFRRWNTARTGPITLSAFIATLLVVVFVPPLFLLGVTCAVTGMQRALTAL